ACPARERLAGPRIAFTGARSARSRTEHPVESPSSTPMVEDPGSSAPTIDEQDGAGQLTRRPIIAWQPERSRLGVGRPPPRPLIVRRHRTPRRADVSKRPLVSLAGGSE